MLKNVRTTAVSFALLVAVAVVAAVGLITDDGARNGSVSHAAAGVHAADSAAEPVAGDAGAMSPCQEFLASRKEAQSRAQSQVDDWALVGAFETTRSAVRQWQNELSTPGRANWPDIDSTEAVIMCYFDGTFAVPHPASVDVPYTRGTYMLAPGEDPIALTFGDAAKIPVERP